MRELERPWDSDLRRVLADELLERGDPRGEYVNLAMLLDTELAAHGDVDALDAEGRARAARCEQLLREHEQTWSGALSALPSIAARASCFATEWRRGYGYARGFPEVLYLEESVDRAAVEAFARVAPLAAIVLRNASAVAVRALAELPCVGALQRLEIAAQQPIAAELGNLLARAGRLESLKITGSEIGEALSSAPSSLSAIDVEVSPALLDVLSRFRPRRLRLRGGLGVTGATKLAKSGVLEHVTALGLHDAEVTAKGLAAVLAALDATKLLVLEVPGNKLKQAGAARIAQGDLRALRVLDVGGANQLGEGLRTIAEAELPALSVWRLSGAKLPGLGAWLRPRPGLRTLDLTSIKLGADAGPLADHLFPDLEDLLLEGCGLDGDGVEALARGRILGTVRRLGLSHNKFQNVGGMALAKAPRLALEQLELGHNWLGVKALTAILERDDMRGLRVFRSGENNFNTTAGAIFARGGHPHLEEAALELDSRTAIALAEAPSSRSLRRLVVSGAIDPAAAQAFTTSPQLEGLLDLGFIFATTADVEETLRRRFGRRMWLWPPRR